MWSLYIIAKLPLEQHTRIGVELFVCETDGIACVYTPINFLGYSWMWIDLKKDIFAKDALERLTGFICYILHL